MILSILVPPAILLLEYKSKAEMAHIPQSQDDHQMTMEDGENNFQNGADDIQMVAVLVVILNVFRVIKATEDARKRLMEDEHPIIVDENFLHFDGTSDGFLSDGCLLSVSHVQKRAEAMNVSGSRL